MIKKSMKLVLTFLIFLISLSTTNARVVGPTGGYFAIDSNEPHGPTFDWIDITATGNYWPHYDDDSLCVPIGFDFVLYGTTYDTVCIGSNGYLTFGYQEYEFSNDPFPEVEGGAMVAPFFDDLIRRETDAGVYYQTLGTAPNRMFVVTWHIEDHYYSSPSEVTFQVILYEGTNYIKFQYLDVTFGYPYYDYGASATVGLNKGDGVTALQYSYNEPVLEDNMAILIVPVPTLLISKSIIDFNYVKIGKTKYKEIVLFNPSMIPIDVNLNLTGDYVFGLHTDIGDNPCGGTSFSLAPNQSCEIYVSFSPDNERTFNAILNVNSPTIGFNTDIPITGIGAYPIVQILGLEDVDYKLIVRGQTNIIEIKNTGNVPLEIFNIALSNLRYFEVDLYAGSNPCGTIFGTGIMPLAFSIDDINADADFGIPPGTSCTIGIKSKGTDERKTATLKIQMDDPSNSTIEIFLQIAGFIEGSIDNSVGNNSSSSIFKLSGGSGGCNFASTSTLSFYLLIPVLIAMRRKLKK